MPDPDALVLDFRSRYPSGAVGYRRGEPQRPGVEPPWEWLRLPDAGSPAGPDGDGVRWRFAGTDCAAGGGRATGPRRHLMLAFTSALPGRREEYDRWYSSAHMAEIVSLIPGYVSARRYVAVPGDGDACPWDYLGLYHVECDDVAEFHRVDAQIRARGVLTADPGLRAPGSAVWLYTEQGTRRATGG